MPVQHSGSHDIERALEELFPGARLSVRHREQTPYRATAYGAEVESRGTRLQLLIVFAGGESRGALLDTARSLKLEQQQEPDLVYVLAAPFLTWPKQQMLREAGVPYLDLAGNAWLVRDGVHIDRRGFGNPEPEKRQTRDPFSDKASLVSRVLLRGEWPLGIRQIAEQVGSTPGYVSKVAQELERRGYVARREGGIVLRHAEELLQDWLVSYRRHRNREVRSFFVSSPEAEETMPTIAEALDRHAVDYVFSGQAGASLVDRHATFDVVDVYVRDILAAHDALAAVAARPVTRGGNVTVSVPYYRASAFFDSQVGRQGMRAASDVQLYLDLYDYPVRGREQAEHLYERRLRPVVERSEAL